MTTKEKSETALNIFVILFIISLITFGVICVLRRRKFDAIVYPAMQKELADGCGCNGKTPVNGGNGGNPGGSGQQQRTTAEQDCASVGKCWDGYQCVRCKTGQISTSGVLLAR